MPVVHKEAVQGHGAASELHRQEILMIRAQRIIRLDTEPPALQFDYSGSPIRVTIKSVGA
jgi:hypothetical protein